MLGSCMFWGSFVVLCVCFCPLESMAAWVVAGDTVQLGLIIISGGFRAAAPKRQCWIVNSPTEWYQTNFS